MRRRNTPQDLKPGLLRSSNNYGEFLITYYKDTFNVGIVFIKTSYEKNVNASAIRSGSISDKSRKQIEKISGELSHEYVMECFSYDKDTGILMWKKRPLNHFSSLRAQRSFNASFAGNEAGCPSLKQSGKRYSNLTINIKQYRTHRVIWFLVKGYWPDQIDHDDGNGLNNKWDNINDVTFVENMTNKRLMSTNKSGVTGVHWEKTEKKWKAVINLNKKLYSLGCFHNFNDAVIARKMAEYELGFHKNHGDDRPL